MEPDNDSPDNDSPDGDSPDEVPTEVESAAADAADPDPVVPEPDKAAPTGTDTSGPTGGAEPRVPGPSGEPEPIDLVGVTEDSAVKRLVPIVLATILGLFILRFLLRRRRS